MNSKKGFTIPELMIAMSFLSMLLIVLLLSTMNIISIYNKGLTLKRVNQSGASIGAAMQKSLRSSAGKPQERKITIGSEEYTVGFCTGKFSYIWNLYGTSGADPVDPNPIKYNGEDNLVGFAKVSDTGGDLCKKDITGNYPNPERNASTEMLGDGLVMKQPTLSQDADDGKLISFIYTISTSNSDSDFAEPPTGSGLLVSSTCAGGKAQGDDFCALNTFVITSYASYNKD
jgi:type II secretory pathway pseudopilin PulG